jgi:Zinc dependent phospholipase C
MWSEETANIKGAGRFVGNLHPSRSMKETFRRSGIILLVLSMVFCCSGTSRGYSVLTHEELIDLAWNDCIRPTLLARFPRATEEQLVEAHAYAYGGSAIQDMGYYPFGKRFFSNLTHYVRTGDFVVWMFQHATTVDELAFAMGALSHYVGDSIGHSEAINPATAIEFPKLEHKFGPKVTYGESPHGHIRTEFAFDIDELINAPFAPPAYWQFIGFKVPRKFLERAFINTYGFDIHQVLGRARPALRSYRTSVRSFIPAFAQAEVVLHRHQFPPHPDDEAYRIFSERVTRTNYERRWRDAYRGPGFKAHLLAILVFIVPKVGAVSDLAIKIPDAETQDAYIRSVNHSVDAFREDVKKLAEQPDPPTLLENVDLDTGRRTKRGDYPLADETYAHLLARLASKPGRTLPEGVKRHVLEFYDNSEDAAELQPRIQQQLSLLRSMKVNREIR